MNSGSSSRRSTGPAVVARIYSCTNSDSHKPVGRSAFRRGGGAVVVLGIASPKDHIEDKARVKYEAGAAREPDRRERAVEKATPTACSGLSGDPSVVLEQPVQLLVAHPSAVAGGGRAGPRLRHFGDALIRCCVNLLTSLSRVFPLGRVNSQRAPAVDHRVKESAIAPCKAESVGKPAITGNHSRQTTNRKTSRLARPREFEECPTRKAPVQPR